MFGSGFKHSAQRNSGIANPLALSNCKMWLRADLGMTTSSGLVTNWADQTGNSYNFIGQGSSFEPTLITSDSSYNNQATVHFTGTQQNSQNMAFALPNQPITVYVVGEGTNGGFFNFNYPSGPFLDLSGSVGGVWEMNAGTNLASSNSNTFAQAFAAVFNTTNSSLYIDSSTSFITTGNAGTNASGSSEFLAYGGTTYLTGKIAEFVVYNVAHTSAQVAKLFQYFSNRYGKTWV